MCVWERERERERSRVSWSQINETSHKVAPIQLSKIKKCHANSVFIIQKQQKVVFIFHNSNSVFLVMSYENWEQKLNQTISDSVEPTKCEWWVMKNKYWVMKTQQTKHGLIIWVFFFFLVIFLYDDIIFIILIWYKKTCSIIFN